MTSDGKTIDKIAEQLVKFEEHYNSDKCSADDDVDWTFKRIAQWKAWDQDKYVQAHRFGYEEIESGQWYPSRPRTAIEEMVRWRLWDRTGGGLMAELGSHQLDAASIFIFDFPGQGYDYNFDVGYEDKVNSYPPQTGIPAYNEDDHSNKRVVVTYSSINGNGYGGYGEVVMGTKATMVLDREKEVMLYPIKGATPLRQKLPKVMAQSAEDTAKRSNTGHGASSKVTSATNLAAMALLP